MNLDLVIAQLKQQVPAFQDRVAGAAAFKGLKANTALDCPAAFVLPLDDTPEPSTSMNTVRQVLTDSFAVVVAVSNASDERGQGAAAQVHAMRVALWAALLGWQPTDDYNGVEYEGGNLQDMDRFQLWYQFEFSAQMEIGPEDGWQQGALASLPTLQSVHVNVDAIDPMADPNIRNPGPDGRIEHQVRIDNLDDPP